MAWKVSGSNSLHIRHFKACWLLAAGICALLLWLAPARGWVGPASAAGPTAVPARIVAIDPGHGGPDAGATHRDAQGKVDLREKDVNLAVALRLARMLRGAGYQVVLTRETDTALTGMESPDLIARTIQEQQARIDIANSAAADIVVSVHHNGYGDPAVGGTETYYCPDRPFAEQSRVLAQSVLEGIIARLGQVGYATRNRGVKDDASIGARYGQPHSFLLGTNPGIDPSRMPGIFGEALFVSNDEEAALLQRDDAQKALAQGYFDGIQAYFAWLDASQ
ncbi:MAG: N-acetylmuramoyl-L-alanine amidase [Chloroflexi bacterium]|nr:N-acetylmuramoyl-L-alanine amidase [Chloroflexota bacterium]